MSSTDGLAAWADTGVEECATSTLDSVSASAARRRALKGIASVWRSSSSFDDRGQNLVEGGVGVADHLGVGSILNRMRHEDPRRRESECFRLRFGCLNEALRGDEDTGKSPGFEISDVVHTARRAAASIGKRFDHQVACRRDLMT
jgi:hypothetical protein